MRSAIFSGVFAQCLLSAISGHEHGGSICLARRTVNNQNSRNHTALSELARRLGHLIPALARQAFSWRPGRPPEGAEQGIRPVAPFEHEPLAEIRVEPSRDGAAETPGNHVTPPEFSGRAGLVPTNIIPLPGCKPYTCGNLPHPVDFCEAIEVGRGTFDLRFSSFIPVSKIVTLAAERLLP